MLLYQFRSLFATVVHDELERSEGAIMAYFKAFAWSYLGKQRNPTIVVSE
jgi:hypothetical protein